MKECRVISKKLLVAEKPHMFVLLPPQIIGFKMRVYATSPLAQRRAAEKANQIRGARSTNEK